jgi:hypothetical protein
MLRNDEIVALNTLMFAERWGLHPWLDIRWDETSGRYSTFILHSSYDTVEDEAECEIRSLEDLNLLLATDAEFYRNVTTLISIGALEAYDIEVEFLVQVIVDRIAGAEPKTPYGYSMVSGEFIPAQNYIYNFDEKEAITGRLALEAIKVLSRTGDWWGETLEIRHINTEWSNRTHTYVPSENKYFLAQVAAADVYRMSCHESVTLTEENLPLLISSVNDIVSNGGAKLAASKRVTQNFWASCLFCERTDEVNDTLSSTVLRNMPDEVSSLFPTYQVQL